MRTILIITFIVVYVLYQQNLALAYDPFKKPESQAEQSESLPDKLIKHFVPSTRQTSNLRPQRIMRKKKWTKPINRAKDFVILGKVKNCYIVKDKITESLFSWKEGEKKNNCKIKDWKIECYKLSYE